MQSVKQNSQVIMENVGILKHVLRTTSGYPAQWGLPGLGFLGLHAMSSASIKIMLLLDKTTITSSVIQMIGWYNYITQSLIYLIG